MTFSARSFAEATSRLPASASDSAESPRGAVPLIGFVTARPARRSTSRNSSGEFETTAQSSEASVTA